MIEDGSLGIVHLVEGHFSRVMPVDPARPWREDPNEAPAGAMTALGVHMVDNLLYVAGEFPQRLTAFSNVAHFVDCIRTRTRPETGGSEGTAVVRILEAMTRSAAENGALVELSG